LRTIRILFSSSELVGGNEFNLSGGSFDIFSLGFSLLDAILNVLNHGLPLYSNDTLFAPSNSSKPKVANNLFLKSILSTLMINTCIEQERILYYFRGNQLRKG